MGTLRHILLLRHGLTDANSAGTIQGHQPTALNALGHEQARRLAQRLQSQVPQIEALISSDLPRASQTAAAIAAACQLPVQFNPNWRERCFGALEGSTAAEHDIWRAASGEVDPPGAESSATFLDRIHHALTTCPAAHPHASTLAIVTHGGPCRAVLRMLISGRLPRLPNDPPPELVMIANCSIMHLVQTVTSDRVAWQIVAVNDTAHLQDLATLRDAG